MLRVSVFTALLLFVVGCGRHDAAPSAAPAPVSAAPENASAPPADSTALLAELTQAVRRYAAEQKKVPGSLDELVSEHYLPSIPAAPAGKRFAIDKKFQVYLTDR